MVLALPEGDGGWSLHSAGEKHSPVLDRPLLEAISANPGPVELLDLPADRPDSPLAAFPHSIRWVYGLAVRDADGGVLAVLSVMDRWVRSSNGRDRRVMQLVARQVRSRLQGPLQVPVPAPPAPRPSFDVEALVPVRTARRDVRPKLLRSSEVAALFDVTERTVINWATSGKLPSIRTVGGHLRFRQEDVMELISGAG